MSLADDVALLKQELETLKRSVQQHPLWSVPSRRPTDSVKIKIAKEAHGLTVGMWVRPGGDPLQWVPGLARAVDLAEGSPIARVCGVVSRVFDEDHFEITMIGSVEGIDNPDDEEAGEFLIGVVYSLSEITPGAITSDLTTTRMECFQATGPHSGMVLQSVNCQADLFQTNGIIAGGKVLNNLSELADAATDTNRAFLGVTINDYSDSESGVACRSGIIVFPENVVIPAGSILWLDPESPGDLTGTKPTTPADQKPIPIMMAIGNNAYWVNPPGMSDIGIGDLWDVDHSTPPAQDEVHIYDDTAKRWVPGKVSTLSLGSQDANSVIANATVSPAAPTAVVAGTDTVFGRGPSGPLGFMKIVTTQVTDNAIDASKLIDFTGFSILAKPTTGTGDASLLAAGTDVLLGRGPTGDLGFMKVVTTQLTDKLVTAAKLADALAYTVVGNGTSATASPVGITAGAGGTVLTRQGTTLSFTANLKLGVSAVGGGTFEVEFLANKSFLIDNAGNLYFTHHVTDARIQFTPAAAIRLSWGSGKSMRLDPADVSGSYDIRFREITICDPAGAPMTLWVLCDAGH